MTLFPVFKLNRPVNASCPESASPAVPQGDRQISVIWGRSDQLSEVGAISYVGPKAVTTDCPKGTPSVDRDWKTAVLRYRNYVLTVQTNRPVRASCPKSTTSRNVRYAEYIHKYTSNMVRREKKGIEVIIMTIEKS